MLDENIIVFHDVELDIEKNNRLSPTMLKAKQGDSGSHFIRATIKKDGEDIDIEKITKATINYSRKDRTVKSYITEEFNIENKQIVFPITYWALEIAAELSCDISLYQGDVRITTPTFYIQVEKACVTDDATQSDDKYSLLVDLIANGNSIVETVEGYKGEIEQVKETIEGASEAVETTRQEIEQARIEISEANTAITGYKEAIEEAKSAVDEASSTIETAKQEVIQHSESANTAAANAETSAAKSQEQANLAQQAFESASESEANAELFKTQAESARDEARQFSSETVGLRSRVDTLEGRMENVWEAVDNVLVNKYDDEQTSLSVDVPNSTLRGVVLNELNGRSLKSENLLVWSDIEEQTLEGITCSVKDGIIHLNGTASRNFHFIIAQHVGVKVSSDQYTLALFNDQFASCAFILEHGVYAETVATINTTRLNQTISITIPNNTTIETVRIYFNTGATFNNATFKPMLVRGSVAPTEFSQGFDGLHNADVEEITSVGKNILPDDETAYIKYQARVKKGDKIYTSTTKGESVNVTFYDKDKNSVFNFGTQTFTHSNPRIIQAPEDAYYFAVSSVSATNKVMVSVNNPYTAYSPYFKRTYDLTAIKSRVEEQGYAYGIGVNETVRNYIDFKTREYVVQVGKVDLGSINYNYTSNRFEVIIYGMKGVTSTTKANILCAKYETGKYYNPTTVDKQISCVLYNERSYIAIADSSYTSATEFKQAMAGQFLHYELAEEVRIDISDLIPEGMTIDTENGGTIYFNNDDEVESYHDITFSEKIAELATDEDIDGLF